KPFKRRRFVFGGGTFLRHQVHVIAGGRDDIEDRFADTVLAQHTIEDLGRSAAPVFHLEAGLGFESLLERVGGESFHGGIDDNFSAFFLGGLDEFGSLSEGWLTDADEKQSEKQG